LLDFCGNSVTLNNAGAVGQGLLLPKLDHFARLANSPSCWLFSQTINALRVAGWAFLLDDDGRDKNGDGRNETIFFV
jgi:hypothetical protein